MGTIRIAVTGASGQLGTHVLRRLCADPRVEVVRSLDLAPPRVASSKLVHTEVDVRSAELARLLVGVDVVIHLAFMVTAWAPRAQFLDVNVGGSRNVFETAFSAGVRRFVYTSSVAAYGVVPGHPIPLVESSARVQQPEFPYADCKWQVEAFLDEFEATHADASIARLRPAILIGEQMDHPFGQSLRAGMLTDVGTAPMPLVWDEDVADAIVLAVFQSARGAFNLSADEPLPTEALARAVGLRVLSAPRGAMRTLMEFTRTLGEHGLARAHDPAWIEHGDAVMVMSCERARTELGWRPTCPTSIDVMRRYMQTVPAHADARLVAFFASATALGEHGDPPHGITSARVHLRVTGRSGGDWTLTVTHGVVAVKGGFPRAPTATVTLSAETLLGCIASGERCASALAREAVAVEGEAREAELLFWLIERAIAAEQLPGARGWAARAMRAWLGGA